MPLDPLELLNKRQDRQGDRIDNLAERLDDVEDDLAVVPLMKRAFYYVLTALIGAIVAIISAAIAILSSGGGPHK